MPRSSRRATCSCCGGSVLFRSNEGTAFRHWENGVLCPGSGKVCLDLPSRPEPRRRAPYRETFSSTFTLGDWQGLTCSACDTNLGNFPSRREAREAAKKHLRNRKSCQSDGTFSLFQTAGFKFVRGRL